MMLLTEDKIRSYSEWVIRRSRIIVTVTIVILIFINLGLSRIDYAVDYRKFFSKEFPQLTAFENLQKIYTKNDNILIAVAPQNGNIFTSEALNIIRKIEQKSWETPYAIRVDAVTNYQKITVQEDVLTVEDLIPDIAALTDEYLSEVRTTAVNDSLLVNRLISADGSVTGINVVLQFPGESIHEGPAAVKYIRQVVDEIVSDYPNVNIYLSGTTMLDTAFSEGVFEDLQFLVPLMYVIIILVMILSLKSLLSTVAGLAVIAFAAMTAMSFSGWLGIKLTPASASAPTMIMTIAIADSIHILLTLLRKMRDGSSKTSAIEASLKKNLKPVLLTSVTTCLGFLTLNFNDSPPFHDLGNITAFGVMLAFILSVMFLPALIAILPISEKRKTFTKHYLLEEFADLIIAKRRVILILSCIIIPVILSFIALNKIDDRFVEYFDDSIKFRQDTDFIMNNLTGIYYFAFSLPAGSEGGICDPEYLKSLDDFENWLKQDERVSHVYSFSDIIKKINQKMNADQESFYSIPESRELAAQYLLMYEFSLPFGQDLNNIINIDKSATRFTVTLNNIATSEIRQIAEEAELWLQENFYKPVNSKAAGTSVMFAHIFNRNIHGMLTGMATALVFISLLLFVAFNSARFGLLSLIPNLIPCLLAFGLWGLFVGEVGLALSGVGATTLGIVVDDTIHFLHNYLKARRQLSMNSFNAVKYTFTAVGSELLTTSLILVAGFSILTLSAFRINSDLGTLTAITIAVALIADFILLPVLLILFDKR